MRERGERGRGGGASACCTPCAVLALWHIWGFRSALYATMSIAARVLELAWTTGVIYVLSRLFVARARVEIVSYSRKISYRPPPTVDATRCTDGAHTEHRRGTGGACHRYVGSCLELVQLPTMLSGRSGLCCSAYASAMLCRWDPAGVMRPWYACSALRRLWQTYWEKSDLTRNLISLESIKVHTF